MKKFHLPLLLFLVFSFTWSFLTFDSVDNSTVEQFSVVTKTPKNKNPKSNHKTNTLVEDFIPVDNQTMSLDKPSDTLQGPKGEADDETTELTINSILKEITLRKIEEKIVTSSNPKSNLQTRFTLLETNMKHPYLLLEEKGVFENGETKLKTANAMVATHLMLKVHQGTPLKEVEAKLSALGCSIKEGLGEDQYLVTLNLDSDPTIDEMQIKWNALEGLIDLVATVEPDYFVYAIRTPNDARMIELWGLHNSGQTGGSDDKDIDAYEAWDLTIGKKDVLVGVIDTGIDRNHEDLLSNMWTNPNEIPANGLDDDGNGFVDDVHGWDFYNNDNDPFDDNSHGTHCAGTIGAVGNNGKGVVGVNWEVSMVGIKFLGGSGGGYLSDAVKSISYGTKIGVDLTSNSWGGGGYSSSMKNAIDEASIAGIGFIAAAGNHAGNNDAYPSYPASYESENVISVGAHNHFGKSAYFSCYGKTSVDLFAPGVSILSTTPGNRYASFSGTSMATPHVAGAYALLLSVNPEWKSNQVKNALLENVDLEGSLTEKCLTGGRLNTFLALSNDPPQENLISASPSSLNFGVLGKEESQKLEFILSNRGNADTTVQSVIVASDSNELPPYEVSLPTPFILEPNMAQTGSVSFVSSKEGIFNANLLVKSDATNESNLSIPLTAEVVTTPQLLVEPTELHFGLQENEILMREIQLSNLGDGELIYSILPRGDAAWMTFEQVENGTIAPGQSIKLFVQASAKQMPSNYEKAMIEILSNDSQSPSFKVQITAERLTEEGGLVFRPSSINFGETLVGRTTEKTIEMFNAGMDDISISRIAFEDAAFSHYLSLPINLAAGEKYSASIYFTPLKEGTVESNAKVLTDENGFLIRALPLAGNSIIAPKIIHNPDNISANLKMNQESKISFNLQNGGGSVLNWSMKGANGLAGSSYSLGATFPPKHYDSFAKGSLDHRTGPPVSSLGGGPDYYGYSWSDSSDKAGPEYLWKDISQSGVILSELSALDDGFAPINLPFSFKLYGQAFDQVFVSSNGYLTFGQGSSDHNHFPLPSQMMAANLIAAFATDLDPSQGGNIYYLNDENGLTVQYDQVHDFAGLGEYTFQININAGGVIRFIYENMNGALDRATTGIQNASTDMGLLVAYNNKQIKPKSTVRISTSPKWLHTTKLEGSLQSGESENIEITLKAGSIMAGSYEAKLEISSNDPDQKIITIPVSLTIETDRTLELTPNSIDFGSVEVGLSKSERVTFKNVGNAPIPLENLSLDNGVFSSDFYKTSLQPSQSFSVNLTFKPINGGLHEGRGTLSSDAQNSPHIIEVYGNGLATPKLKVVPEILNTSVEAGNIKVEKIALENFLGLSDGNFSIKEIRSKAQSSAAGKFSEYNQEIGEVIPKDIFAQEHSPNELIVAFKSGKNDFENPSSLGEDFKIEKSLATARKPGSASRALSSTNLILVKADDGLNLAELAMRLSQDPAVEYAEPNYLVRRSNVPNDPDFSEQWALEKIDSINAWKLVKGSETTVVAVIDTGIDYHHPDLQGNIWTNPGEIAANGIDDDSNGYVDDVYGWDFINSDNDPMDGHNHGTHVAGTIAAATNNGNQVAGVAWHTKLAALKLLSDGGWGYISDAIDAIAYCAAMEIPISNNSWGGGGYSQALKDIINQAGDGGHLFCASAGNSASDNDSDPHYPASFNCSNIISVAASDQQDNLAYFSCYGKTTVDLAAPGTGILNLITNGETGYMSGTSMAAPHVAGAAALLLSQNQSATHQELKNLLMNSVDPIESYQEKMVAAGRLNLFKALEISSPSWLTVTPRSGSVKAGSKVDLDFVLNATNLIAGTKHAIVSLNTNDPLATLIEIPVNLTVTGKPKIVLDVTSLDFGEIWVGNNRTLKLSVSNSGTDLLQVNKITLDNHSFFTTEDGFNLSPGDEKIVEVTAQPQESGKTTAKLVLNSNDPVQPDVFVILELKAITPPSLSYAPSSIFMNVEPEENAIETITVNNGGQATGEWEARIVQTNVKRSRNLDFDKIISGLNAPGRSPDFNNPSHPLILDGKAAARERQDAPNAIRYEGSNQSGLEVGILGADYSYVLENFGSKLSALDNVAGVTTINVSGMTPNLEEITPFDAVIVFSNYRYWDNEALGNLIEEYASTGGGVITMPAENLFYLDSDDWSMTGNWRTEELSLFDMEPEYEINALGLGDINLPNHPLVEGVNIFSGDVRILHEKANASSTVAASWADGTPLITFRTVPNLVVDLNFYPNVDYWDQGTDGWLIIKNALNWTTRSYTPSWLKGSPMFGKVEGHSQQAMELTFNASGLSEGNYTAEVHFSSNDPEESFFAVEVKMEVQENQAPIANSKTIFVKEDEKIEFSLDAFDPDGDELNFLVIQFPMFGSLEGANKDFSYAPAKNFNGTDKLIFKVTDGRKESAPTTILFEVESVNDRPWANSFEINASEDEFFLVDFQYGDIDGDELELEISKLPANGFLWQENNNWLYFPNNHFNGEDTLRYFVHDGELESTEASVMIRLKPTNDAPVAKDTSISTDEDSSITFELFASDVENDSLSFKIIKEPLHGRLWANGTNLWTYTPFDHYSGKDSFSFQPFDGLVHGNIGNVNIMVHEVNDAPHVHSSTFNLKEDANIAIKLIASDPEGDPLSFKILSAPHYGTIVGEGPNFTYSPDKDFNGVDSFEVQANDGELWSETAKITLIVESQNDSPYIEYNLAALSGGIRETPLRVDFEVKDEDNDEVKISLNTKPNNGTCYIENQQLVFLPSVGFTGIEKVNLQLNDGTQVVTEELVLTVNSHQNPYKIKFDHQTDHSLINMLYQANEILVQNNQPVLQLEKATSDESISASLSTEEIENAQDLNQWLMNINDLPGSSYVFYAHETQNRLHWKVASFLDPASGTDTDNDRNTNNSNEPSNEEGKEGKNSDEVSEKPDVEDIPFIEILGSSWYKAQGLGLFFDSGNGWIYHIDLGWCFLEICSDQSSFWIFHESLGWFWMSQEFPSMIYLANNSSNGWYYFPTENLADSKFIYSYENQSWFQWNE